MPHARIGAPDFGGGGDRQFGLLPPMEPDLRAIPVRRDLHPHERGAARVPLLDFKGNERPVRQRKDKVAAVRRRRGVRKPGGRAVAQLNRHREVGQRRPAVVRDRDAGVIGPRVRVKFVWDHHAAHDLRTIRGVGDLDFVALRIQDDAPVHRDSVHASGDAHPEDRFARHVPHRIRVREKRHHAVGHCGETDVAAILAGLAVGEAKRHALGNDDLHKAVRLRIDRGDVGVIAEVVGVLALGIAPKGEGLNWIGA